MVRAKTSQPTYVKKTDKASTPGSGKASRSSKAPKSASPNQSKGLLPSDKQKEREGRVVVKSPGGQIIGYGEKKKADEDDSSVSKMSAGAGISTPFRRLRFEENDGNYSV